VNNEFVTVHGFISTLFPSPWAWFTVNSWVEWTVIVSPGLFSVFSTEPDFTNFERVISVDITIGNKDSVMFGIEGVFWVDGSVLNTLNKPGETITVHSTQLLTVNHAHGDGNNVEMNPWTVTNSLFTLLNSCKLMIPTWTDPSILVITVKTPP
jgi:hypothetical protein